MNNILKSFSKLEDVYRRAGMDAMPDVDKMIEELTEASYKNNVIENLVNISYLEENTRDVSELSPFRGYEILTFRKYDSEYNYFETEEEFNEHIEQKISETYDLYKIEEVEDDEDITYNVLDENGELVDTFYDREDAKDCIEELKEEFISENDWDDLEVEYDEIYWNTVFKPEYEVDIESAQKAGLGVLVLYDDGEKYLFLRGCGMDMSFQFVKYYAYAEGRLPVKYLDRLSWTEQNSTKESFKHILTCLGVDVSRLSKYND